MSRSGVRQSKLATSGLAAVLAPSRAPLAALDVGGVGNLTLLGPHRSGFLGAAPAGWFLAGRRIFPLPS